MLTEYNLQNEVLIYSTGFVSGILHELSTKDKSIKDNIKYYGLTALATFATMTAIDAFNNDKGLYWGSWLRGLEFSLGHITGKSLTTILLNTFQSITKFGL